MASKKKSEAPKEGELIRSLLNIDRDINRAFRESKLPLGWKKYKMKKQQEKLEGMIQTINHWIALDTGTLKEYIDCLASYYPPTGKYRHCTRIAKVSEDSSNENHGNYSAVFEVPIRNGKEKETGLVIIAFPEDTTPVRCSATYMRYRDGQLLYRFFEDGIEFLTENQSLFDEYSVVKNTVIDAIIKDIAAFLMDNLERSKILLQEGLQ